MERVRRLVIVTSRFPFGTQETYLATELRELAKYFERIAIVPIRTPAHGVAQEVPAGVEVLAWPIVSAGLLLRAARAFFRRPRESRVAISQLLGSHDPGRSKNAALLVKALALGDWTIEHGFEHIHAYWISAPASVAFVASAVARVPWSSTAHRWDIYERNAFDVKQRSAAFVRTISARGKADVAARMPSLAKRVFEMRLGTELPARIVSYSTAHDRFNIVCPAALVAIKGHDVLFDAIAELRKMGVPIHCSLCGTGPLREELAQRAVELGIESAVEFCGFVPQQQLHEQYRQGRFCAVVLASRSDGATQSEGVPSALIEAMAFSIPVIATNSGGITELLDERCGRVVTAGRADELARALLDVYLDPGAARVRAVRAYEVVARRHDVRTQMRAFANVLAFEGGST